MEDESWAWAPDYDSGWKQQTDYFRWRMFVYGGNIVLDMCSRTPNPFAKELSIVRSFRMEEMAAAKSEQSNIKHEIDKALRLLRENTLNVDTLYEDILNEYYFLVKELENETLGN